MRLSYSKGTIIIHGDIPTPYGQWDPRVRAYRAPAYCYRDIVRYLERSKIPFKDEVLKPISPQQFSGSVELYPFQKEAFERWMDNGCWGTICIATAGGKTFIGLKAIEVLRKSTIILAPTLALIDQWMERLEKILGINAGILGGGKADIKWVTVSTYDSAYIRAEELGDKFELLIADEAHHIFAPAYCHIAEIFAAPYRMGLTSTLHRSDMRHLDAPRLIGGVVYEATHDDLAGVYIAPYEHKRIYVDLTPEEREEYDRLWKIYTSFLEKHGIRMESNKDFQKLIAMSATNPEAREALLARAKALKIALNSESKMSFLKEQLKSSNEKTIIFTLHNSLVYEISRRFLIPAITHETSEEERKIILEKFKSGEYKAIVTSLVLDEGIDVPDASRGIVLAGYGSPRQHIQRLGRLLRKREGKRAILFEIISRETKDVDFSRRRRMK
ncbi:MAG: DEAD/DEAH box helicase family protein [Candidatus Methanomethyliaceae archaeon]|nr:DEAD/DEAH box helicase family protein [Candidatus Methanomethyliaceae archaeon]MDW7970476.1 DEAD/DEAH box helicase family protein [Nitrososphaerota archaeon]